MSENIKKINFSALKKNTDTNNKEELTNTSPPVKQNIPEEKEEDSNRIVTVSLGKKKIITKIEKEKNPNPLSGAKIENKKESDISLSKKSEENTEKVDVIKLEEKKEEKIETKVEKHEEKIIKKETNDNPTPLSETKIENKKEEKVQIGNEKELTDPKKMFNNYESDFNTKEDTVIERLKKLKDLPKTRPKLVYSMIGILVIGVSGLVFISPQDSILNNYKASILGTKIEQNIKTPIKNNIEKKEDSEGLKNTKDEFKKKIVEDFLLSNNKKSNRLPKKNNDKDNIKEKNRKLKEFFINEKNNK